MNVDKRVMAILLRNGIKDPSNIKKVLGFDNVILTLLLKNGEVLKLSVTGQKIEEPVVEVKNTGENLFEAKEPIETIENVIEDVESSPFTVIVKESGEDSLKVKEPLESVEEVIKDSKIKEDELELVELEYIVEELEDVKEEKNKMVKEQKWEEAAALRDKEKKILEKKEKKEKKKKPTKKDKKKDQDDFDAFMDVF